MILDFCSKEKYKLRVFQNKALKMYNYFVARRVQRPK